MDAPNSGSKQPYCVYGNDDLSPHRFKEIRQISYRWSDIITAPIVFALVLVLYYLDNYIGFVVAAVFAMLYAIIVNRRIVGKLAKKLIRRR